MGTVHELGACIELGKFGLKFDLRCTGSACELEVPREL